MTALRGLLLALVCLAASPVFAEPAPAVPAPPAHPPVVDVTDEVRVLIDVSGSMKHTDPQNLRAPALRLLVNLLPAESRAGVWTFAQQVNPVVPVAAADADWRKRALAASAEIHSRGLFTDIGAVLKAATHDWQAPDPATRRSLILLTDGMVDVSKTPGENERARAEILQTTLPALRAAGVHVHTIALSSQADAELLKALAATTDGGFAQTESAEELQRLFLHMFERSVKRDAVPLEGNRFQVDASIQELTLLAFQKKDTPPARLRSPGGQVFGAEKVPPGVRWTSEAGYNLVTITKPTPGEWQLIADIDPDNRVMIVTDLKLKVSELPNNLFTGESVTLSAELHEGDAVITRPDFLSLMNVRVLQESPGAKPHEWRLVDDGAGDDAVRGDGVFSVKLGETLVPGDHALVVDVDGKTFRRQLRLPVRVVDSPVRLTSTAAENGDQRLVFKRTVDWIDPAALKIEVRHVKGDGSAVELTAAASGEGEWTVVAPASPGLSRLEPRVSGHTTAGREFALTLPAIEVDRVAAEPAAAEEPPPEEVNWGLVAAVLFTGNVALFGVLGLVYYLMKQRRRRMPGFADDEKPSEPTPEKAA